MSIKTRTDVIHHRRFTTWRYEPPEATEKDKAWSRRYDTWSVGCIILEFIVWVVYGNHELDEFNKRIVNEFGKPVHYFEHEMRNGQKSLRVHSAVSATMKGLAQQTECTAGKTALGDLLRVVRKKLLVVELSDSATSQAKTYQASASTQTQPRVDSGTLKKDIVEIIEKGRKDPSYWFKGESSDDLPSLSTPQAVSPEPDPQSSLTVSRKRSSGSDRGLLTADSSSLFVPILTESVGVG